MTRMLTSRSSVSLDRVEADRLIVALERNVSVTELGAARRLVAAARRGYLPTDGAALARRCLKAEGNAPALLRRLAGPRCGCAEARPHQGAALAQHTA